MKEYNTNPSANKLDFALMDAQRVFRAYLPRRIPRQSVVPVADWSWKPPKKNRRKAGKAELLVVA